MIRLIAPDIIEHDAVGNFCLDLADCLHSHAQPMTLYAEHFAQDNHLPIKRAGLLFSDIQEDDIIISSYSIYDPHMTAITSLPQKKICYFHGVTTPSLLEKFEPVTADLCRRAQEQFSLLRLFDIIVTNSKYTASFITPFIGEKEVLIVPPIFSTRPLLSTGIAHLELKEQPYDILMVNRVIPHKNIELAIEIFSVLKEEIPQATLTIVGECSNKAYFSFLQNKISELKIRPGAVNFLGKVSNQVLRDRYLKAKALLCVSLHEGFCIPVLEAMSFGIPVFVRKGNAAEEVAGEAGVLFDGSNPSVIGDLIIQKLHKPEKLSENVMLGRKRAEAMLQKNNPQFWLEQLCSLSKND